MYERVRTTFTSILLGFVFSTGCGQDATPSQHRIVRPDEGKSEREKQVELTENLIALLNTPMDMYFRKRLPPSGIEHLAAVLYYDGFTNKNSGGPYIQPGEYLQPLFRNQTIFDPWGDPLIYENDGDSFIIYSRGPNGRDEHGSGDDITTDAMLWGRGKR